MTSTSFIIVCQVFLGVLGLIYFFRTDTVVKKYRRPTFRLTLQEVRRGGVLIWLLLALDSLLRIHDIFYPHISN